MDGYEKYEIGNKNEFFSEPEEIDYFQNHEDVKNPFDDEEDVKKYLSFDFWLWCDKSDILLFLSLCDLVWSIWYFIVIEFMWFLNTLLINCMPEFVIV